MCVDRFFYVTYAVFIAHFIYKQHSFVQHYMMGAR